MSRTTTRTITGTGAARLAAAAIVAATAAGCSAGPDPEQAFQDALTEQGIAGYAAFGDRLNPAGRAVCTDLRAGMSVAQLAQQADALKPGQRVPFVRTAAATFCPETPA